jgi:hypothetical protein
MSKTAKVAAAPAPLTADQITELADKIGLIKAQLAPLEAQLKADIDKLKAMGADRYLGNLYEVNIFPVEQNRLDMEAVRAKLSTQFITAHTKTSISLTAKVQARTSVA